MPQLVTPLPGSRAQVLVERDRAVTSPSYTRGYPLVVARGEGCMVEDVDGNVFLDLTAGIAVASTEHAHPEVVAAVQAQAANLLHMSGTDFYESVRTGFTVGGDFRAAQPPSSLLMIRRFGKSLAVSGPV